ncbi:MAG TPA: S8 family serine peptidase, partial [Steroidobacteraceae bacterium]|nr:S8 family serine peptidase [Steroidobacteraceae bacterium]
PWCCIAIAGFLTTSVMAADRPAPCGSVGISAAAEAQAPAEVGEYLRSLSAAELFDLRKACARWAALDPPDSKRRRSAQQATKPPAPRFILYPKQRTTLAALVARIEHSRRVRMLTQSRAFVAIEFGTVLTTGELLEFLAAPEIGYFEPDCDGPDFVTTSAAPALTAGALPAAARCWQRGARASFPDDPCMDELWGHAYIGWDAAVAAQSVPRLVAVLDSGIDVGHEDLAGSLWLDADAPQTAAMARLFDQLPCATPAGCYPHGTQMAGTIAGRMNNGVGVAGVAPHSRLMPVVISRVEHGNLVRLSAIAGAIEAAGANRANIINISAKWPVDSRAVREAVSIATGGERPERLLVTGYTASFAWDESLHETYPSRYRCLPGVVAAVPGDMRGEDLRAAGAAHADPTDSRMRAPGVDIVVTTTHNEDGRYALAQAAGASSASAYLAGAAALTWGSKPLDKCGAREIKAILFCRSKRTESSQYPWVHVEFLRELSRLDSNASCNDAMAALGCGQERRTSP